MKPQIVSQLFPTGFPLEGGRMSYNPAKIVIKKDYLRRDGTAALYLQVIIERKKKVIPLDIFVKPEDFNEEEGHVKRKSPFAGDYNLLIDNALAKASDIFLRARLNYRVLSIEDFQKEYLNYDLREDFILFFESKMKLRLETGEITKPTHDQNRYVFEKLKAFKPLIKFNELTTDFLHQFNRYLDKLGNCDNTKHKNLTYLKTYINLARKEYSYLKDPFQNFNMPKTSHRVVFLTQEEVRKWMDYYYSEDIPISHKNVSRAFLYMVFTSLRVSDCFKIDHEMIHGDMLVFVPEKNKRKKPNPISIPLTPEAKRFIVTDSGKIINTLHPQYCNRILKNITEKLGIKKNITNHAARHTFATLFLERGGDVATLNKIMDHSKIEMTMVYVHITNERKKQQMNSVFSDFYKPV